MHCHILPGVDDGAKNEDSMERMLCIADAEGIEAIIATPHFALGEDEQRVEAIKTKYDIARSVWKKRGPQKELYLGSELLWGEGIIDALESGKALTMNGTSYVLVEFLPNAGYEYIENAIRKLQYAGYLPIIAHVERYGQLKNRKVLKKLVDMRAYLQVNVSVILGNHGFWQKHRIVRWLKEGLIHFVGTDAHNSKTRKPEMKQCVQYLEKKLGIVKTRRILEENPKKVLEGERLDG